MRQELIRDKQYSKYLLYAGGEILLVVIGILIALQIGIWSQVSKDRKEEHRILLNLEEDLKQDIDQLKTNIELANSRQVQIDSIYLALGNPTLYSIEQFASWQMAIVFEEVFSVNSGSYDESISSGTLKLITDETLREEIFTYYRIAKENYMDRNVSKNIYEQIFPDFFEVLGATHEMMNFVGIKSKVLRPINVEALAKNNQYLAMLGLKYASQNQQIIEWEQHLQNAEALKEDITRAIEALK